MGRVWIMKKEEIAELRSRVSCAALLDHAGFAVDTKESTRKAIKYRLGGQIVIVIHDGQGWFDPLSDAKGDIFTLAMHLGARDFPGALDEVTKLVGYSPSAPVWQPPAPTRSSPVETAAARWAARRKPWKGSRTWTYLTTERRIPESVLRTVIAQDLLREGPFGSMWACHRDASGVVCGWEERGPDWRGFSTAGDKLLFSLGNGSLRLCISESAIDAMSLAAVEGIPGSSRYLSAGGGWSPATTEAVRSLAQAIDGATLVAATDDDQQGDVFAERIETIAREAGCAYERKRPALKDWNLVLVQSAGAPA